MPRHTQIFGQVTHQAPPAAIARGQTQKACLSGRFANDAQQRLNERGFAGAVTAEETKNLTPLDSETYALEGHLFFAPQHSFDVSLAQVEGFDRGLIRHHRCFGAKETCCPETSQEFILSCKCTKFPG